MMKNFDPTPTASTDLLMAVHALALQWAMNRTGYDTAHDLAADVALKFWRHERPDLALMQERGQLQKFVFAATHNAYLDRKRQAGRRAQYEAVFEAECRERRERWMAPDDELNCADLAGAMHVALNRTPPRRRQTYLMVAEGEMSYAAVAEELKISPRTVEARVRRTRVELRETMAKYRSEGTSVRLSHSSGGEK